ncbi:Alpha/beta hydrolase family-domain-containing protein [Hyaloraphidium curvatum]|nr:Alpha/beta hydrolase family-domain-containing protein [Hyaloraphidium curvatum]
MAPAARTTPYESDPVLPLPPHVTVREIAVDVPAGTAGPGLSRAVRIAVTVIENARADASAADCIVQHATGVGRHTYLPLVHFLFELLGPRLRTVVLHDARNHGDSAVLNTGILPAGKALEKGGWDWPTDSVADAGAVVDALGLPAAGRPFLGIGHSFGGALLAMLELERKCFTHLVLVEPIIFARYPPTGGPTPPTDGVPAQSSPASQAAAPAIPKGILNAGARRASFPSPAAARQAYQSRPFFRTWHPACFDLYIDHGLRETSPGGEWELKTVPEQEAATFKGGGTRLVPLWKRLPEIACKVLVLSGRASHHVGMRFEGRDDKVVTKDEAVASWIPGARHTWFEASHMVCQDRPVSVARAAAGFLGGAKI